MAKPQETEHPACTKKRTCSSNYLKDTA